MKRFGKLRRDKCPFANLPGATNRTVGSSIDCCQEERLPVAETELVGQFEFLEWTPENHLRHTRFVGLRDDKTARDVRRER